MARPKVVCRAKRTTQEFLDDCSRIPSASGACCGFFPLRAILLHMAESGHTLQFPGAQEGLLAPIAFTRPQPP